MDEARYRLMPLPTLYLRYLLYLPIIIIVIVFSSPHIDRINKNKTSLVSIYHYLYLFDEAKNQEKKTYTMASGLESYVNRILFIKIYCKNFS